jgi:DNA mismatch repair ATPase MutL
VIYNIPTFFADYADDLEYIVRMIMTLNDATFEKISDQLYAEKACKASIKAGQRLHPQEMQSLIKQ